MLSLLVCPSRALLGLDGRTCMALPDFFLQLKEQVASLPEVGDGGMAAPEPPSWPSNASTEEMSTRLQSALLRFKAQAGVSAAYGSVPYGATMNIVSHEERIRVVPNYASRQRQPVSFFDEHVEAFLIAMRSC